MTERPGSITRGDFLKLVLFGGWVPEAIRNRGLGGLSRPAQISLAKDVALFAWPLAAACGSSAADRVARTDSQWKGMLKKQGEIVERDLAGVGLMGYRPLTPFDQLTTERRKLLPDIPRTGFVSLTEGVSGRSVGFLWSSDSEPTGPFLVTVPYGVIKTSILDDENQQPQVRITLDLARFITYRLVSANDPRYQKGEFSIIRYNDPRDYLNTPNAIISVDIKGSRESLSPILQTAV